MKLPTTITYESSLALLPLDERRRLLREELRAQRAVIVEQLGPSREDRNNSASGYPRSMTMRFLTEHAALTRGVLAGAATLLVGVRYGKTIAAALTAFKAVRAAVGNGRS